MPVTAATSPMHVYEVRPRKDHRVVDLISLPKCRAVRHNPCERKRMNALKFILLAGLFAIITAKLIPAQDTPTPTAKVGADLDAPAQQPVTVRSEIQRGVSSLADAELKYVSRFRKSVDSIRHTNEQKNTCPDAFLFGLYYSAWHHLWLVLSNGGYRGKKLDHATAVFAKDYYEMASALKRRLSLSEDDLEKVSPGWHMVGEDQAFETALNTQSFKDTYRGGRY
jgi:hypothetical protein